MGMSQNPGSLDAHIKIRGCCGFSSPQVAKSEVLIHTRIKLHKILSLGLFQAFQNLVEPVAITTTGRLELRETSWACGKK